MATRVYANAVEKIRYNGRMQQSTSQASFTAMEKSLRHLLTLSSTLLVLAGFGALIYYFYSMTALLGAVLIATYLLIGPVNLMEKGIVLFSNLTQKIPGYGPLVRKSPEVNPRILAVLLVYAIFFFSLVWSSNRFVPILWNQFGELGRKLSVQLVNVSETAIDWTDHNIAQGAFRQWFEQDLRQAERQGILKSPPSGKEPVSREEKRIIRKSVLRKAVNQVEDVVASAVPNFISLVGGTVNGFVYFLVGLLLTFYLLIDGAKLKMECLPVFPPRSRGTVLYLMDSFHQVMFAFIKGQVLLGLLTGFYMFIVYSIFHVPYAFLLGSLFAAAELLPVIGTWIGIIIGLTVILLSMEPTVALWVWLCSYGYQTIKDNILAPKVVGDVMGLHPMAIILALMICAKVAGLLGVLLALPLASLLNVILRLLLHREGVGKSAEPKVGGSHA